MPPLYRIEKHSLLSPFHIGEEPLLSVHRRDTQLGQSGQRGQLGQSGQSGQYAHLGQCGQSEPAMYTEGRHSFLFIEKESAASLYPEGRRFRLFIEKESAPSLTSRQILSPLH